EVFDPFDRPFFACKGVVACRVVKFVEGCELAAFGGHRRVNRRATRIQIRGDTLLIMASAWHSQNNTSQLLSVQVRLRRAERELKDLIFQDVFAQEFIGYELR